MELHKEMVKSLIQESRLDKYLIVVIIMTRPWCSGLLSTFEGYIFYLFRCIILQVVCFHTYLSAHWRVSGRGQYSTICGGNMGKPRRWKSMWRPCHLVDRNGFPVQDNSCITNIIPTKYTLTANICKPRVKMRNEWNCVRYTVYIEFSFLMSSCNALWVITSHTHRIQICY